MSGNDFHSGYGVADKLRRSDKHNRLRIEETDPARGNYFEACDEDGNFIIWPKRNLLTSEYIHIRAMIRKLFGIVLVLALIFYIL